MDAQEHYMNQTGENDPEDMVYPHCDQPCDSCECDSDEDSGDDEES